MPRYETRTVYIRAETNEELQKLKGIGFSALVNDLLLFYLTHKKEMDKRIKNWRVGNE